MHTRLFALSIITFLGTSFSAYAATHHVDASVVGGTGSGDSWANAFTDLQAALAVASGGDEIWVATGTYRPTADADRAATFNMKDDVSVYGGFPSGGGVGLFSDRDVATNVTTLSGDLPGDNSYSVVTASTVSFFITRWIHDHGWPCQ